MVAGITYYWQTSIWEATPKGFAEAPYHPAGEGVFRFDLGPLILVYIRSDNGPEFIADELQKWLARTLYIERGSSWENGYCESFNGKLRDECLNGEIFYSLKEAQIVIEKWRVEYNTRGGHTRRSATGRLPPRPAPHGLSQSSFAANSCDVDLSLTVVQNIGQVTSRDWAGLGTTEVLFYALTRVGRLLRSFTYVPTTDRKRSSTRSTVSGFAYSTCISTCPKSKTANLLSKVKLHWITFRKQPVG